MNTQKYYLCIWIYYCYGILTDSQSVVRRAGRVTHIIQHWHWEISSDGVCVLDVDRRLSTGGSVTVTCMCGCVCVFSAAGAASPDPPSQSGRDTDAALNTVYVGGAGKPPS